MASCAPMYKVSRVRARDGYTGARHSSRWGLNVAGRAAILVWLIVSGLHCSLAQTNKEPSGARDYIVLPEPIPDPIEPFNRAMWDFNEGALTYVVKPSGKVYRFIVVKPIRTGISNVGKNIGYPGRVINNLLQTRWSGARDETYRFLANSVLGIGGLWDAGTKLEIPPSEADFGQTFGLWGWRPHIYLMLPIMGPSNDRDGVGLVAEKLTNPLTYFSPYSYIPYGITYNNLVESVDEYVRISRSELDPYTDLHYVATFSRETDPIDFALRGEQDAPSLETLQTIFFTFRDRNFPEKGDTRSVLIPETGKKLQYTLWLQPGNAPIVYINPGLGSHRLSRSALGLAELLYNHGFSAVAVSSTFNYDFMEHASTAAVPGYVPVDTRDMHSALTLIDADLEKAFPKRIGQKALVGFSMGAFQTLVTAANERESNLLRFDRYVAIDTPVRLTYAAEKLDLFYHAPLDWPVAEQPLNTRNTLRKAAALVQTHLAPDAKIPLNAIESKFLIGAAFHLILRDAIYSSQARTNMGVLQHPMDKWRREDVYREILQLSFADYLQKFVAAYYQPRGIDLSTPELMAAAGDLRRYEAGLKNNASVRVIENENDVLAAPEDIAWLRSTIEQGRLMTFEHGGHLGNLIIPDVQEAIIRDLEGLGASPPSPRQ
jgi:ABC-type transporter lipoprotein component MlaA/pimeloyl-ACP methyl ester carboxylesterase